MIYVGAPMHFDFGDVGPRYCWYVPALTAAPLALSLKAPRFVTTTYPRVPVAPLEESGFLRVLSTPRQLFEDVKKAALDGGWFDSVVLEEAIPEEAVRALSAAVMVDEEIVRGYVTRHYPDVDDETRARVVNFGLDCLRVE